MSRNSADPDGSVGAQTEKPTVDNLKVDLQTKLVFAVFGLAPSWMAVNAIMQQVPYFERTQPEGMCLTAFLTLGISCGLLWVIFNQGFVSLCNKGKPVAHAYAVPMTMGLCIFTMFFMAAFWHITVDNASIFLYMSSWLGGGVGGLTQVLVMPFLALYKSDCLTAFRMGMDIGGILCALVSILQRPGSPDPLFGPTIFFSVFGVFLCSGIGAYRYILATGIGLAEEFTGTGTGSGDEREKPVKSVDMIIRPIPNRQKSLEGALDADKDKDKDKGKTGEEVDDERSESLERGEALVRESTSELSIDKEVGVVNPMVKKQMKVITSTLVVTDEIPREKTECSREIVEEKDIRHEAGTAAYVWRLLSGCFMRVDKVLLSLETQLFDAIFAQICHYFPRSMKDTGWFRITLPYMCTIFYMDANNFGLLPSLIPLALANSTTSLERQTNLLQINFQVGAFTLVFADFFTFYFDIPLRYPLFAYTALNIFIYVCGISADILAGLDVEELDAVAVLLCCSYIFDSIC